MTARTHVAHDDGQHRLAVLIDADNAQASVIEGLLAEVAKFGLASVKRIYGDFTTQQQGQWKKVLLKHSISPVQQFAYTSGKNATDSALIIDAMDLMYTGRFDGMCLVSSDSDFTRLAQRLREEGLTVYGFGEHKTPDPFVQACDKFIYTEVLRATAPEPASTAAPAKPARKQAAKTVVAKAPVQDAPASVSAAPCWRPRGGSGTRAICCQSSFAWTSGRSSSWRQLMRLSATCRVTSPASSCMVCSSLVCPMMLRLH